MNTMSEARANHIATQVAMQTGTTYEQQLPEAISHFNEKMNLSFNAGLFTLLSNVRGIASVIGATAKYLFPIAFALKAADWFFYLWAYVKASNKNASKTNNLILKTITTAMVGMVVFGAAVLGATASPLLFAAVMAIDLTVTLGKSFYYAYLGYRKEKYERHFYLSKAKENITKTIVGGILLGALVVTLVYGSPAIAASVVAGMGLTAAITLIGLAVTETMKWFKAKQANSVLRKEIDDSNAESLLNMRNIKAGRRTNHAFIKRGSSNKDVIPFAVSKTGFFSNHINLLKPISSDFSAELKNLKAAIKTHTDKLKKEINIAKDGFFEKNVWSEGAKRSNKLQALQFLNHIVDNLQEIRRKIISSKPVTIDGVHFNHYHNVQDLIEKINNHVTSHFQGAYQAFFEDIGGVEALFKHSYKLLTAAVVSEIAPPVDTSKSAQSRRRNLR